MNYHEEQQLAELSRLVLNASVEELDNEITDRLRHARTKAVSSVLAKQKELATVDGVSLFSLPLWLAPASSATVFASVILLTISLWLKPITVTPNPQVLLEDIKMLTAKDELEFYENLDFYIWLSNEESNS